MILNITKFEKSHAVLGPRRITLCYRICLLNPAPYFSGQKFSQSTRPIPISTALMAAPSPAGAPGRYRDLTSMRQDRFTLISFIYGIFHMKNNCIGRPITKLPKAQFLIVPVYTILKEAGPKYTTHLKVSKSKYANCRRSKYRGGLCEPKMRLIDLTIQ